MVYIDTLIELMIANAYATGPIYITCFLFDKRDEKIIYLYKIESTLNTQYPFQLFKQSIGGPTVWKDLSTYTTVHDAIWVLLKELVPKELADEIDHGQATLSPKRITDRLNKGEQSVSIFKSNKNRLFRTGVDIIFEDMIQRK